MEQGGLPGSSYDGSCLPDVAQGVGGLHKLVWYECLITIFLDAELQGVDLFRDLFHHLHNVVMVRIELHHVDLLLFMVVLLLEKGPDVILRLVNPVKQNWEQLSRHVEVLQVKVHEPIIIL